MAARRSYVPEWEEARLANRLVAAALSAAIIVGAILLASAIWFCSTHTVKVWGTDYNSKAERFSIDEIKIERNK